MNLEQWLEYLESPRSNRIRLGLDRIKAAAISHSVDRFSCPVVTVAGTNGKGSCVALLETIYSQAGFRVGSYTSPHLYKFNERIKINLQPVDDNELLSIFNRIGVDADLSYFEFSTLAALMIFQQANLDLIILEVGLGGRLDCVNIIEPTIALITQIDIDHSHILGSTRDAIAKEKAGIFRNKIPVVCADPDPPQSLRDHAKHLNCNLQLPSPEACSQQVHPANVGACRKVTELLQSRLPISKEIFDAALNTLVLPARLQYFKKHCDVIVDVAHNPASVKWLAQHLTKKNFKGKTIAVFAMMQDKDIPSCIKVMSNLVDTWHVSSLDISRAASSEYLLQTVKEFCNQPCYNHGSIVEAFKKALGDATEADRIIVFGSFYTIAGLQTLLT